MIVRIRIRPASDFAMARGHRRADGPRCAFLRAVTTAACARSIRHRLRRHFEPAARARVLRHLAAPELIAKRLTPDLLNHIAAEHRRGRRLLVLTTNLDAERP